MCWKKRFYKEDFLRKVSFFIEKETDKHENNLN